jgi:hypothetical protein
MITVESYFISLNPIFQDVTLFKTSVRDARCSNGEDMSGYKKGQKIVCVDFRTMTRVQPCNVLFFY